MRAAACCLTDQLYSVSAAVTAIVVIRRGPWGGISLAAGQGPGNNRRRDGFGEYDVSEPVVQNDAKGMALFPLCCTEIKRLRD